MGIDFNRFQHLAFEDFAKLAADPNLSEYEKIGFPDSYRRGYGEAIFADIRRKLPNLEKPNQIVVDVGPGCSELPKMLIDLCREKGHTLILIDIAEMLDLLPDAPFIQKIPAYYPEGCPGLFEEYAGRVDIILSYSVLQIVFTEGSIYRFFDKSLSLLNEGGQMLIGDIPNVSKRRRFFSTPVGIAYHKAFMNTDAPPEVAWTALEADKIDDGILLGLLMRARGAGFDSYLMPQPGDLPLSNRREDLLILKP